MTLTPEPRTAGRLLDARLHLLDRQMLDVDGVPISTVDDLELEERDDGVVVVTALLTGSVLGARLVGGRPPASRRHRLPWAWVTDVKTAVDLSVHGEDLEATWLEKWTRDHIVARIPGGRHK